MKEVQHMVDTYKRLDTAYGEQGDHVPQMNPEAWGTTAEELPPGIPANAIGDATMPNAENFIAPKDMPNNSVPDNGTGALEVSNATEEIVVEAPVEVIADDDVAAEEVAFVEAPAEVEEAPVVVEEVVEVVADVPVEAPVVEEVPAEVPAEVVVEDVAAEVVPESV